MIRTVVIPASNNINLHIPNNYIGKEIEVFFYAKEELVEDTKAPTNNMAKFKGILSNEEATKYDSHLKQARNEWNRDF